MSIRTRIRLSLRTALATLLLLGQALPARADGVADFYHGKAVTVVIAFSAGGGYDLYARLLARYMSKHIPGNPTLVPQNMPGAGTLKAARYLYSIAPKDGTVFGIFSRSMPIAPIVGLQGADFDARKFTWLGSMAEDVTLCITSDQSGVRTWDDALKKDFTVGGEGNGSDPDVFANVLKNVLHAKARLITGYPGTADMMLAVERGELGGLCGVSYSSVIGRWPEQLRQGKMHIIIQGGFEKNPALADVPNMLDLVDAAHAATMRLMLAPQAMARPFTAPPGIPAERAHALQEAFAATLQDPELLADAKKLQIDIGLMTPEQIGKLLDELYTAPKAAIAEAAANFGR
jgi:tripartite-type tricarboxylate transporter receptor subunit TctC